ncbi:MAG: nuclear transport factor 2 family protein [Carboxylicivirga sp.]|nr:nuclear transport factor 2 family protein [Carboxylicivirga sp.]
MRCLLLIFCLSLTLNVLAQDVKTNKKTVNKRSLPSELAQQQLEAYNNRDIEAFLIPYVNDVEVYAFPNELKYKGKETMRKIYAKMFKNTPNLHCHLVSRMVQNNIVIDQEKVHAGDRTFEAIAIYHIEDGKIKKVFFIQ